MSDASVTKAVSLAPTDPVPTPEATQAEGTLQRQDAPPAAHPAPTSAAEPKAAAAAKPADAPKAAEPKPDGPNIAGGAPKAAAAGKPARVRAAPKAPRAQAAGKARTPRASKAAKAAPPAAADPSAPARAEPSLAAPAGDVMPAPAQAPAAKAVAPEAAQAALAPKMVGSATAVVDSALEAEAAAPAAAPQADAAAAAAPVTRMKFSDFPVADEVKHALQDMGYVSATDVQEKVIEPALAGRDLLVQSKTGSGKTTAFGVPLVHRIEAGTAQNGRPRALVLLPTRELAHQVGEELTKIGAYKKTTVQAIYGGVPLARQMSLLQRGTDIVVGTPGRLLDHIRRKNLSLTEVQTVVLDEADEMLSMGFWDDVTELIRLTPKNRQTLLFSATLPYEVAKSAQHLMNDVVKLDLSADDLTVSGIENCIVHVKSDLPKPRQLLYVLEGERPGSAIIFCNTRNETEILAKYLTQSGFVAEPLSGNFRQKERERTMARIKSGELRFMVATDIAARGIDIDDLTHVFNYALPEFCEVYLHRVGRTGRAGKVGKAVSLVDGKGLGTLSVLEREFGIAFTEMTMPPEAQVIRARSERIMKELYEKAQMAELAQHLPVAQDIVADANNTQLIAFLLKAYFNSQAGSGKPRLSASEAEPAGELSGAHAGDDEGQENDQARARDRGGRSEPAFGRAQHGRDDEGEAEGVSRRRPRVRDRGEQRAPAARDAGAEPARDSSRSAGRDKDRDAGRDSSRDAGRNSDRAPRSPEVAMAPSRRPHADAGRSGGNRDKLPFDVVDASEMLQMPVRPSRSTAGPSVARVNTVVPAQARQAPSAPVREPAKEVLQVLSEPLEPGMCRLRVNIGFDDGFKGRGAVAKKISALAGLNEGIVTELESRRDHAVLKTRLEVVEMVRERVDGARLGKKILTLSVVS